MDFIKQKSRGVFYIVAVFIVLLIIQVFLYGNFFEALKADMEIIHDLSRVRGLIQRYAKLEISGDTAGAQELKAQVDVLMSDDLNISQEKRIKSLSQLIDLKLLHHEWAALKSLTKDYQAAPNPDHLSAVISKSEECWQIADANVLQQQYTVNKTAAYYTYFTFTFGFNLLVIVLALFLYKRYILNKLAASAIHDALTGVFNKGYFDEYLDYEIARAVRKNRTFCLVMLDIDHFKHVNDNYGHNRGDYALKALAETVGSCKRNTDVLARVGGEEFIVLLPDTAIADAIKLAERIRKTVEDFSFEEIGRMTISLGVTEFKQTDQKEHLLKRVDSALYRAKENGRNRWESIGGEEENE